MVAIPLRLDPGLPLTWPSIALFARQMEADQAHPHEICHAIEWRPVALRVVHLCEALHRPRILRLCESLRRPRILRRSSGIWAAVITW